MSVLNRLNTTSTSKRLNESLHQLIVNNQFVFVVLTVILAFLAFILALLILVSIVYSISICHLFTGRRTATSSKKKQNEHQQQRKNSMSSSNCIDMDKSQLKSLLKTANENGSSELETTKSSSEHIGLKLTKFLCTPDPCTSRMMCDKKDDNDSNSSVEPVNSNLIITANKFANDKTKVVTWS